MPRKFNKRKSKDTCYAGLHDLNKTGRIEFVQDKRTGAVYSVRRCRECQKKRIQDWHKKRKAKDAQAHT